MPTLDRMPLRDLHAMWGQALTIARVMASGGVGLLTGLSALDPLAVRASPGRRRRCASSRATGSATSAHRAGQRRHGGVGGDRGEMGNVCRDAIDAIVDTTFSLAKRNDVSVRLAQPADDCVALARLPGALAVESSRLLLASPSNGRVRQRIQMRAGPTRPGLWRIVDIDGRTAKPGGDGLLLSERLATEPGLRLGDRARLQPQQGAKREFTAAVDGPVRERRSLDAAMNRALGDSDLSTGFGVLLERDSEAACLAANQQLPRAAQAGGARRPKRRDGRDRAGEAGRRAGDRPPAGRGGRRCAGVAASGAAHLIDNGPAWPRAPQNRGMSPIPEDDDPTHALDDFVRRMRAGTATPDAAPDLSDLGARLHPERPSAAARPRGGTLRSGQTWDADDVQDVPEVELHRPPAARSDVPTITLPRVDLDAEAAAAARTPEITLPPVVGAALPAVGELDATTRDFNHLAAAQWDAEAESVRQPAWQPDPRALRLRRQTDPRLLDAWQPGVWTGAQREVFAGTTELLRGPDGGSPVVETYAPHRLLLLWPPQRLDAPLLGRWAHRLRLAAVQADDAPAALLADLPEDARLWLLTTPQDVDWALAAETVLHHTSALRPFQVEGLRTFIAAEREASYARLNADYFLPEAGAPVRRR